MSQQLDRKTMALFAQQEAPSDLIAAGFTPSDLRAAGFTPSDLIAAGWTDEALQALEDAIPLVERPYSRMLEEIRAGERIHDQATFGPECDPVTNVCGTPMCTAGHLVNLGGSLGWQLKRKYGWHIAAGLIHYKAHPNDLPQNFGAIPQAWAMAYIEEMAEKEAANQG